MSGQVSASGDAADHDPAGDAASRRVFVYGTLRRAHPHRMATFLAAHARHLGEGTVEGLLVNLGSYPGLSVPGEIRVVGDLYEFGVATAEDGLAELDAYEGCSATDPRPHEYRKATIDVTLAGGETLRSGVYLLNGPPDRFERIESGDYLAWLEARGSRRT